MTLVPPVTRFAPSPTGWLHLGHAHAALFAYTRARAAGGTFLLRIEDIDPQRCRPDFETGIREDLAWLGLDWPEPVRRQSDHLNHYASVLDRLRNDAVVYPCFCSRKDIQAEIARAGHAPHGPEGPLYPGLCRPIPPAEAAARVAAGEPHAWRLNVAAAVARTGPLRFYDHGTGWVAARPETLGDVVLARRDVPTSYHLSVVVDDGLQGITLVTRARDLFPATHLHRLLQALLDLPVPAYHHHGLLTNAAGERLSKRDGAKALRHLRAEGLSAAAVRALAGFPDSGPGSLT